MTLSETSTLAPARPGLLVDVEWLAANLRRPDLRILDSTTLIAFDPAREADWATGDQAGFEAGHIPGAQLVDLQRDLSAPATPLLFMVPSPEEFARAIRGFGIDRTTTTIIYSRGNPWWATRVWWLLQLFGLDAAVLDGGWRAWRARNLPVELGVSARFQSGRADVQQPLPRVAEIGDVLAAIGDDGSAIVNALPAASHSGSAAPTRGRPGHIAGSVNLPAADLLDPETGRFLPIDAVEARLRSAGLLDRERVIAYCGGGVAATAIAFALALVGQPEPLVYDGSLQQWANDERLPMEIG